jgi:predicted RNA-binding protein
VTAIDIYQDGIKVEPSPITDVTATTYTFNDVIPGDHTYSVEVTTNIGKVVSNEVSIYVAPYITGTVSARTSYYLGQDGVFYDVVNEAPQTFTMTDATIDPIDGANMAAIGANEMWDMLNKYTVQIKNDDGSVRKATSDVHINLGGQDIILVPSGSEITFDIYTVVNVTGPNMTSPRIINKNLYTMQSGKNIVDI